MINSLTNRKLYINDNKICLIVIVELFNLSNILKKTFSTCEIFLNIIQLNNYSIITIDKITEYRKIIDLIICNFPFNEFLSLLIKIKEDTYLNNIITIEFIIKRINLNLQEISQNFIANQIGVIKNELDELFNKLIDNDRYSKLLSLNIINLDENKFNLLLFELLSIIIQINNIYLFVNTNLDYFQKLISFIKDNQIKDKNIILGIFKAFFFELYNSEKDICDNVISEPNIKRLKYLENKMELPLFIPKKMDNYLFNYFIDLINFICEFEPNEDIMKELLEYFNVFYNLYYLNINTKNKNYNYAPCNLTHIFNSKKIIEKILNYLNLIISKNNNYREFKCENFISFQFERFENPVYFSIIKKILYDTKKFHYYNIFVNKIIDIISKRSDKTNNLLNCTTIESNKDFYSNSIELLNIFYLSTKYNKDLLIDKNFIDIFIKYFGFLERNKILLSKYLIKINSNDNNFEEKTILEICICIFMSIASKNNNEEDLLKKILFKYNKDKSLLFILDSLNKNLSYHNKDIHFTDLINKNFNNFLKNNENKEERKSILIIIINKLLEIKIQNNNNSQINYNEKEIDKYLQLFIDELFIFFKSSGNWKKISKDKIYEDEISLFKGLKEIKNNEEIIKKLLEFKNKNEREKNENNEIKIEKIKVEEKELIKECPNKKDCFLLQNSNINLNLKNNNALNSSINVSKSIKYKDFMDIEPDYNILCLKRDLLLKQCSIYFSDIYFKDKNFSELKKYFKCKIENKSVIKIHNEIENKFNYPTKIKNYSNSTYAYPAIFYKPYTSFYNLDTLNISHPYYHKEAIKKSSFPLLLSHYYVLKDMYDDNEIYFQENCEAIMKNNIICGNIFLKEKILLFLNDNEIIKEYGKNIKYLFGSIREDIKIKNKIIIIKYKDIKEILIRRYIYDFRALEIFLKNGKSYLFNLYSNKKITEIFDLFENKIKAENKLYDFEIIKEPKIYFDEKKYNEMWQNDEISTFQYLLYINKFSSRTYNDISQYPIMPWIFLNNTDSNDNDFNYKNLLPKLRNMAYPISIKNDNDIEDSKFFFQSSIDENPNYPNHFRLHYSTSGYLLNYLSRASPYTEEQIHFQGGEFDNPNRQIQYINEILQILSESHDNRELIPEFFIALEFFMNVNYNYFGYRSDKEIINDMKCQDNFNSLTQYIYYNRLLLNNKNEEYKKEDLNINLWIDLIFGTRQWDQKPNIDNLNLFNKYCYKQNINFEHILEKFKIKNYDEKKIIKKIENKKSRIINFGQCPEVLFTKKIPNCLLKKSMENKEIEELLLSDYTTSELIEFKNKEIVTFWINEDNNFIYFLVFNNNNNYSQSILVYGIDSQKEKQEEPKYIINIKDIILFKPKGKVKSLKVKKSCKKINDYNLKLGDDDNNDKEIKASESTRYKSFSILDNNYKDVEDNERNINLKDPSIDIQNLQKKVKTEKKQKKESENAEINEQYYYKISPKYALFDIYLNNLIYLFIGRNMDNSIKIYEQTLNSKKSELKYNIFTDSFASCLYKKDKDKFFSGHKNGKLYEWKIIYSSDNTKTERKSKYQKSTKNIFSINRFELERDILAHKESMICTINYVEKHDIIITSSLDGNLYIRKYFDFELLTIIQVLKENSVITKVIYSDYDFLYLLISQKDKDSLYNSYINIYTLNGLLIESSQKNNFVDIEPLKNGKIICNNLYSNKLKIFGFNKNKGELIEEDILKKNKNWNNKIVNFIFQQKKNLFYLLLDNGKLYKICNEDFRFQSKGVYNLNIKNDKDKRNSSNNIFSINIKNNYIRNSKKTKTLINNGKEIIKSN